MEVVCVPGVQAAIRALQTRANPFPLVLTDLVMPDGSGMDVLAAARERSHLTQVIVITAYSTVEAAIDAMRQGAYDFVTKPFSPGEIAALAGKALEKSSIVAENARLRAHLASVGPPASSRFFGDGAAMRSVVRLVDKAATTRATVLITGESGTGKERVARALHQRGDRASGPFCVVNCGALPEALMESELFGHEKGAFTGASSAAIGMFRQAHGGTLLLDEVGELPLSLQVKMLRVLQERSVRPVGSTTEIPVDVRLLAATNCDVEEAVERGTFRKDLYYRLNVIRIELPPLRDRDGDIRKLAEQMIARFAAELGKEVRGLTPEAVRALDRHTFPGNIRELENMMERAVALAVSGRIGLEDLPDHISGARTSLEPFSSALPEDGCDLDGVLEAVERRLIEQALSRTDGVRMAAAKLLGISFRSLRYRLSKLGFSPDSSPPSE